MTTTPSDLRPICVRNKPGLSDLPASEMSEMPIGIGRSDTFGHHALEKTLRKLDHHRLAERLDDLYAEAVDLDRMLHVTGLIGSDDPARRSSLGVLEQLGYLRHALDRAAVVAGLTSPYRYRNVEPLPATRREARRAAAAAPPWAPTIAERRAQRQAIRIGGPPYGLRETGDGDCGASAHKAENEIHPVPPPELTQ